MEREAMLRELLDRGWSESDLRRAAAILRELESDETAMAALRDYDQIRGEITTENVSPGDGWDAMERRLQAALDEACEPAGGARSRDAGRRPSGIRGPLGRSRPSGRPGFWGGSLLAASLLIVGGAIGFGLAPKFQGPATPTVTAAEPAPTAVPTGDEVAQQVRAFDEVSRTLDHKAAWVSLSDQASDVGVTQVPVTPTQRLLMLRLSVQRGREVVSRADLVIVPGHTAELTVPLNGSKELHYVISVTDDRYPTLSLWAELEAPNHPTTTLAALATQLRLQPGQAQSVGEFVTGTSEYQLTVGFAEPHRPAIYTAPEDDGKDKL